MVPTAGTDHRNDKDQDHWPDEGMNSYNYNMFNTFIGKWFSIIIFEDFQFTAVIFISLSHPEPSERNRSSEGMV